MLSQTARESLTLSRLRRCRLRCASSRLACGEANAAALWSQRRVVLAVLELRADGVQSHFAVQMVRAGAWKYEPKRREEQGSSNLLSPTRFYSLAAVMDVM